MARKKTQPAKKPLSERLFPQRKKAPRRPEEKLTYLLKEVPLLKVTAAILLYQGARLAYDEFFDESEEPIETSLTTIIPKNVPLNIGRYFDSRVGEWKELTIWDFEDNLTFVQLRTNTPIKIDENSPSPTYKLITPNKIAERIYSVFDGDVYPDDATSEETCDLMNLLYTMLYDMNNAQLRAIYNAFLGFYGENLAVFLQDNLKNVFSDWQIRPYERTIKDLIARLGAAGALKQKGQKQDKETKNAGKLIAGTIAAVYFLRN